MDLYLPGLSADEVAGVVSEAKALDALYSGKGSRYGNYSPEYVSITEHFDSTLMPEAAAARFCGQHDTSLAAVESELFWGGPLDANGFPSRVHVGSLLSVLGY